ncbi:unnamed protein product, partial [Closterium sp. NIES-54]
PEPCRLAETRRPAKPRSHVEPRRPAQVAPPTAESAAAIATAAATPTPTTAATTSTATMANFSVLTFDAEGRAISFDVWLDDLQLYLQSEARDGNSLFMHTKRTLPAPAATAVEDHSKWLIRDATARLTVHKHLSACS